VTAGLASFRVLGDQLHKLERSRFRPGRVLLVAVIPLVVVGCHGGSDTARDAALPSPDEVFAEVVPCSSTVFADAAADAMAARDESPTGLRAIECWVSSRGNAVVSDSETLITSIESLTGGTAVPTVSRCRVNLEGDFATDDGRWLGLECRGDVIGSRDGSRLVVGFYSGVVLTSEQLASYGSSPPTDPSDFMLDGARVEWMVVVGEQPN
jgi:hypothetical protein